MFKVNVNMSMLEDKTKHHIEWIQNKSYWNSRFVGKFKDENQD